MVSVVLDTVMVIIAVATLITAVRIVLGPTLPDRVVAVEGTASNVIALVVISGMRLNSTLFFDIAIAMAILTFLTSVTIGKYLAKGEVIHGDSD